MSFHTMHEKHWQLYSTCWKHNVCEFRERIWAAAQSMHFLHRLISILGTYAIGLFLLRFIRDQFKARFGSVPDWMV